MHNHEKIDYLELPATDIEATKGFFTKVFRWRFEDFGAEYCAFYGAGIEGGFYASELSAQVERGSVLVVFYSDNLRATQRTIEEAGGVIVKPIFSFPGGKRFHFNDPNGNEYAVWSETHE